MTTVGPVWSFIGCRPPVGAMFYQGRNIGRIVGTLLHSAWCIILVLTSQFLAAGTEHWLAFLHHCMRKKIKGSINILVNIMTFVLPAKSSLKQLLIIKCSFEKWLSGNICKAMEVWWFPRSGRFILLLPTQLKPYFLVQWSRSGWFSTVCQCYTKQILYKCN